jgi:S-formylglutathione hydrolase FrmB
MEPVPVLLSPVVRPGTKTFSEQLTQAGIKNIYYDSLGTAHEWLTWRRSFKEFAPLMFR